MSQRRNPTWWNAEYESGWDRVKAAFKRDWDQTKHDMGANEPDTDQDDLSQGHKSDVDDKR